MLPYNAETSGIFFESQLARVSRGPAVPAVQPGLVFDVGAFDGDSIPLYRAIGGKEFFCFEPDPVNFAALHKQTSRMGDVTRFPIAVSDRNEMVQLTRVEQQPLFSTLEPTWADVGRHAPAFRGPRVVTDVRAITLDHFIAETGLIPDYLKLDVEGHELAVLMGLSHKPNHCTFEWVVERPEATAACIGRLYMLGFRKFGVGLGEQLPTVENSNFDFQNVISRLCHIRCCCPSLHWGNIWCE